MDTKIVEDVHTWRDEASVQLKAVTSLGDPADLSDDEARRVAQRLLELAGEDDDIKGQRVPGP